MARLAAEGEDVVVAVLTGHGEKPHPLFAPDAWDQVRQECQESCSILGVSRLLFKELPAVSLDVMPAWQINTTVMEVLEEVKPDTLYVPFANDLHKDHGAIAYAASVAARPYLPIGKSISRILAYETLSETHLSPAYIEPAFQPSSFCDISNFIDLKVKALSAYKSQLQPECMPRSLTCLRALATLRGSHIGVEAAEAFVLLRETC